MEHQEQSPPPNAHKQRHLWFLLCEAGWAVGTWLHVVLLSYSSHCKEKKKNRRARSVIKEVESDREIMPRTLLRIFT